MRYQSLALPGLSQELLSGPIDNPCRSPLVRTESAGFVHTTDVVIDGPRINVVDVCEAPPTNHGLLGFAPHRQKAFLLEACSKQRRFMARPAIQIQYNTRNRFCIDSANGHVTFQIFMQGMVAHSPFEKDRRWRFPRPRPMR